jgi:predicted component of type VI protein secretion system
LAPLLRIVEQHNREPREMPGRRLPQKDNFLLGPHIFQVLVSLESRSEVRQRLPVLDQPAAEVRNHLQKVAADCKALAELMRKGPQPHVALAGETRAKEALKVFAPWTELFEADGSERQVIAFAGLLERGADWFDGLADHVPRASQNRHIGNGALRVRAAEFLPGVFRRRLDQPYHAHVATIATIVSGIETDADFVKKAEAQQHGPKRRLAGERLPEKTAETLP